MKGLLPKILELLFIVELLFTKDAKTSNLLGFGVSNIHLFAYSFRILLPRISAKYTGIIVTKKKVVHE